MTYGSSTVPKWETSHCAMPTVSPLVYINNLHSFFLFVVDLSHYSPINIVRSTHLSYFFIWGGILVIFHSPSSCANRNNSISSFSPSLSLTMKLCAVQLSAKQISSILNLSFTSLSFHRISCLAVVFKIDVGVPSFRSLCLVSSLS